MGLPLVRPRVVIYPTRITDANGNFIDIAYRENTGPEIDTITDTLGRITHFYYDANGLLTAVTAPINASSLEGTECITACTTERTLIRLHYRPLTIGAAFAGPDPDGPQFYGYAAQVIDSIVHPDSKSGYWFGDGDSFSSYGMITKVSEQRGMGLNALSLVDQGVATPGAVTRQQIYNYPANPDPKLQGPPTYTTKTETWEAMDTPAAVTRYLVQEDVPATPFAASTLQRVEVIRPDLTRSVELTKLDGGLPVQKAIYAAPVCPAGTADCPRVGQPVRRTELTWEANPGAYDSPRLLRTETTDERNQVTAA